MRRQITANSLRYIKYPTVENETRDKLYVFCVLERYICVLIFGYGISSRFYIRDNPKWGCPDHGEVKYKRK